MLRMSLQMRCWFNVKLDPTYLEWDLFRVVSIFQSCLIYTQLIYLLVAAPSRTWFRVIWCIALLSPHTPFGTIKWRELNSWVEKHCIGSWLNDVLIHLKRRKRKNNPFPWKYLVWLQEERSPGWGFDNFMRSVGDRGHWWHTSHSLQVFFTFWGIANKIWWVLS